MHLCPNARPNGWAAPALSRCAQQQPAEPDEAFFERQNAAHNGDYLATYPLHNPDSCIIRLKAEVPPSLQPWGCLSIWYHLPRTSPQVSFRLLIKLNFAPLETAQALGISKDSVYRSRHRLSKKLGLPDTGDLEGFVRGVER